MQGCVRVEGRVVVDEIDGDLIELWNEQGVECPGVTLEQIEFDPVGDKDCITRAAEVQRRQSRLLLTFTLTDRCPVSAATPSAVAPVLVVIITTIIVAFLGF